MGAAASASPTARALLDFLCNWLPILQERISSIRPIRDKEKRKGRLMNCESLYARVVAGTHLPSFSILFRKFCFRAWTIIPEKSRDDWQAPLLLFLVIATKARNSLRARRETAHLIAVSTHDQQRISITLSVQQPWKQRLTSYHIL